MKTTPRGDSRLHVLPPLRDPEWPEAILKNIQIPKAVEKPRADLKAYGTPLTAQVEKELALRVSGDRFKDMETATKDGKYIKGTPPQVEETKAARTDRSAGQAGVGSAGARATDVTSPMSPVRSCLGRPRARGRTMAILGILARLGPDAGYGVSRFVEGCAVVRL